MSVLASAWKPCDAQVCQGYANETIPRATEPSRGGSAQAVDRALLPASWSPLQSAACGGSVKPAAVATVPDSFLLPCPSSLCTLLYTFIGKLSH